MNGPHPIESVNDPRVEVFRDVRDRDLRGREGLFMAESEMVIRRLLRTSRRLHSLFLSPVRFEALREALQDLPDSVAVYMAPVETMTDIAGFHIHRGVLAAGLRPTLQETAVAGFMRHLPESGPCLVLAAAGMTNVDNMGGLFRLAAAFGADGVLLDSACCDPFYRKAIRVSMGHALSLPLAIADDLPQALSSARASGLTVWAAETSDNAVDLNLCPPQERAVILVGNEGHGLSDDLLQSADHVVRIPMAAHVTSLNVVSAASVVCWERSRGLPAVT